MLHIFFGVPIKTHTHFKCQQNVTVCLVATLGLSLCMITAPLLLLSYCGVTDERIRAGMFYCQRADTRQSMCINLSY